MPLLGRATEEPFSTRSAAILVALVAVWRLYLSATLQLHPDEAYYWMWSQHLDISYFDHPPMVAYFIWFSTLLSHSELWVRLSGPVVMLLLSCLMWNLSLQLFRSVSVACASVMLFNVYPLTMLGMVVVTPDIPVLLFWSLGVCLFWQIMRSRQASLWYPLGVCFGLALMSKYTAVLMPGCLLLYLLLTEDRYWLKTVHPYLAAVLGLVCFAPVLLWNSRNAWVSFLFQIRNGLGSEQVDPVLVAEYIAGQSLIVGPVALLLGVAATPIALKRRDRESVLLVCTTMPVILFFALSSIKKVAGANWPAFAYFPFSILVASYCLSGHSVWRRFLCKLSFAVALVLALVATLQARFGILELGRYAPQWAAADATNGFHGWRELGNALQGYSASFVAVAPSHQLGAEILYYTDGRLHAVTASGSRPSQFNLINLPDSKKDSNRVYVWTDSDMPDIDTSRYSALTMLKTCRGGNVLRVYYIATRPRVLSATSPAG